MREPISLRPDTPPVAPGHKTEAAAQREAGPVNAVARGTDELYYPLTVPKDEWSEWSADDRTLWCGALGFVYADKPPGRNQWLTEGRAPDWIGDHMVKVSGQPGRLPGSRDDPSPGSQGSAA